MWTEVQENFFPRSAQSIGQNGKLAVGSSWLFSSVQWEALPARLAGPCSQSCQSLLEAACNFQRDYSVLSELLQALLEDFT